MYCKSEISKQPKRKEQQPKYNSKTVPKVDTFNNRQTFEAQKRAQIIEILKEIIQMKEERVNEPLKLFILHQNLFLKQEKKRKDNKGLMYLLSLYGDPEAIVLAYDKEKGFKAKTKEELEEEEAAKLASEQEGSEDAEALEGEDPILAPELSEAPDIPGKPSSKKEQNYITGKSEAYGVKGKLSKKEERFMKLNDLGLRKKRTRNMQKYDKSRLNVNPKVLEELDYLRMSLEQK